MNIENIKCEIVDSIQYITICRPKQLNALNSQTLHELKHVLEEIGQKANQCIIRGVIITGDGDKAFIAGADIEELSNLTTIQAEEICRLGQGVTSQIESLSCPTIACVNGHALGGGLELALACDFIYSSKNSTFGLPEVKLGLIPGFGGTQRLRRAVGVSKAKELTFSGRIIKSDEAFQSGLVLHIAEDKDKLLAFAKEYLLATFKNSFNAIKIVKSTIKETQDSNIASGLSKECLSFLTAYDSNDRAEGTKAFLEKRKPQFN